jgi:ABC-2 type transport system permease protein
LATDPARRPQPSSAAVAGATWSTRVLGYLASPSQLVFNTLVYLTVVGALSGLWKVAVEAAGGEMVGYSALAIVWYITATEVAIMATPPRVIEDESNLILDGSVETDLLRPIDLFVVHVTNWIGESSPRFLACVGAGLIWALWFGGTPASWSPVLLAGVSLVLAIVFNIVAQVTVATSAFWVRDAKGAWFLYQKLVFVVGGMLLPLEVLPAAVERAARVLPFMAMAYAPGRLAAGFLEPSLLLIQVAWLAVFLVCGALLYRRGLNRLRRQP